MRGKHAEKKRNKQVIEHNTRFTESEKPKIERKISVHERIIKSKIYDWTIIVFTLASFIYLLAILIYFNQWQSFLGRVVSSILTAGFFGIGYYWFEQIKIAFEERKYKALFWLPVALFFMLRIPFWFAGIIATPNFGDQPDGISSYPNSAVLVKNGTEIKHDASFAKPWETIKILPNCRKPFLIVATTHQGGKKIREVCIEIKPEYDLTKGYDHLIKLYPNTEKLERALSSQVVLTIAKKTQDLDQTLYTPLNASFNQTPENIVKAKAEIKNTLEKEGAVEGLKLKINFPSRYILRKDGIPVINVDDDLIE